MRLDQEMLPIGARVGDWADMKDRWETVPQILAEHLPGLVAESAYISALRLVLLFRVRLR